jgi:hypothetical protein
MATRTLIDGATDLTATASWSDATIPITGDTAIIPRGSQHIDTFSLSAVQLERLEIAFNGTIETGAGAALAVNVDNSADATAIITGTGSRLKLSAGATTAKWENTLVNSPGSTVTFTGGEFEDFTAEAGTIVLDSTATCDTMNVLGGQVTLAGIASASWTCNIRGGQVTINRPGTYNIHGGSVVVDITVAGSTTINMHGGTLVHVNGDFGGEIHATYIAQLEEPATIDTVTISSRANISSSSRVTWSNVTRQGIHDAGSPLVA